MNLEQCILLRHGQTEANLLAQEKHGYVQGPKSKMTEVGEQQVVWSARHMSKLIEERQILAPDRIFASDFGRTVRTAELVQSVVSKILGLSLRIVLVPELREKREPAALEDRSGDDIRRDPRLQAIRSAIKGQDLSETYQPTDAVPELPEGYQTWPQKFKETKQFLERIIADDTCRRPLLVSHGGTLGTIQLQLDYGLDVELELDEPAPSSPSTVTAEEMFNNYLFKYGNAQGIAYQCIDGKWQLVQSWTRPDDLGLPGQAVYTD